MFAHAVAQDVVRVPWRRPSLAIMPRSSRLPFNDNGLMRWDDSESSASSVASAGGSADEGEQAGLIVQKHL